MGGLVKVHKSVFYRAIALSGVFIFIAGIALIGYLGGLGVDPSVLGPSGILVQFISYCLSLIGFSNLLILHNQRYSKPEKRKSSFKPILKKAALVLIIAGLSLTFPLLQLILPLFIAEILVLVGLVSILLSFAVWIVTLFFPRDIREN